MIVKSNTGIFACIIPVIFLDCFFLPPMYLITVALCLKNERSNLDFFNRKKSFCTNWEHSERHMKSLSEFVMTIKKRLAVAPFVFSGFRQRYFFKWSARWLY